MPDTWPVSRICLLCFCYPLSLHISFLDVSSSVWDSPYQITRFHFKNQSWNFVFWSRLVVYFFCVCLSGCPCILAGDTLGTGQLRYLMLHGEGSAGTCRLCWVHRGGLVWLRQSLLWHLLVASTPFHILFKLPWFRHDASTGGFTVIYPAWYPSIFSSLATSWLFCPLIITSLPCWNLTPTLVLPSLSPLSFLPCPSLWARVPATYLHSFSVVSSVLIPHVQYLIWQVLNFSENIFVSKPSLGSFVSCDHLCQ